MRAASARQGYRDSLQAAGVSTAFIDSFLGPQGFHNVLFTPLFAQEHAHPWPPCFLPLLKYRHGIECYGAIVHPFHNERPLTFARLSITDGYLDEVARTETQFLDLIALESSLTSEVTVVLDAESAALLQAHGLADHLPHILAAADACGILEEGLAEHIPGFMPDWPLALYEYRDLATYTGHFPSSATARPACPYEQNFLIAAELADASAVTAATASTTDTSEPGAQWLALQAPGTSLAAACAALHALKPHTDHPLLSAWLLAAEGTHGNY